MTALRAGGYSYDLATRTLGCGARETLITGSAGVILEMLMRRPGAIVTRDAIMSRLYGHTAEPAGDAIVKVTIHRLRGWIGALGGPPLIETVRGAGYAARAEPGVTLLLTVDQDAALRRGGPTSRRG